MVGERRVPVRAARDTVLRGCTAAGHGDDGGGGGGGGGGVPCGPEHTSERATVKTRRARVPLPPCAALSR